MRGEEQCGAEGGRGESHDVHLPRTQLRRDMPPYRKNQGRITLRGCAANCVDVLGGNTFLSPPHVSSFKSMQRRGSQRRNVSHLLRTKNLFLKRFFIVQQMDHVKKRRGRVDLFSKFANTPHSTTGNNQHISVRTCSQQYVFAKLASEVISVTSRM